MSVAALVLETPAVKLMLTAVPWFVPSTVGTVPKGALVNPENVRS